MSTLTLYNDLVDRLKEGGWTEAPRKGRGPHPIWKHPNGAMFALPTTVKDTHTRRLSYFTEVARLERNPPECLCKETPVVVTAPVAVHVVKAKTLPVPAAALSAPELFAQRIQRATATDPWFVTVRVMREAKRLTRQDIACVLGGTWNASKVKRLERGEAFMSKEGLQAWLKYMDLEDGVIPDGYIVTVEEIAALPPLGGAQAVMKGLTDKAQPPKKSTLKEPLVAKPIPTLKPKVPTVSKGAIDRSAYVEAAIKAISNKRLTDEEVVTLSDQIIRAVKATLMGDIPEAIGDL